MEAFKTSEHLHEVLPNFVLSEQGVSFLQIVNFLHQVTSVAEFHDHAKVIAVEERLLVGNDIWVPKQF